jgi:hypothetical protein
MRIAFLTYSYYSGGLGTISHVVPLTRELRKQGVHVDIFSFKFHPHIIGKVLHTIYCSFKNLANYDVIHSQEGAGVLIRGKKSSLLHTCLQRLKKPYPIFFSELL